MCCVLCRFSLLIYLSDIQLSQERSHSIEPGDGGIHKRYVSADNGTINDETDTFLLLHDIDSYLERLWRGIW